jgi:hypothetical protein
VISPFSLRHRRHYVECLVLSPHTECIIESYVAKDRVSCVLVLRCAGHACVRTPGAILRRVRHRRDRSTPLKGKGRVQRPRGDANTKSISNKNADQAISPGARRGCAELMECRILGNMGGLKGHLLRNMGMNRAMYSCHRSRSDRYKVNLVPQSKLTSPFPILVVAISHLRLRLCLWAVTHAMLEAGGSQPAASDDRVCPDPCQTLTYSR